MTFPTSNSINITQLYILPLPRAGPSLTTLETRLTRPRNTSPRVTDKGGNHPDNPRDLVIRTRRTFMSLSTSRSVPYILPPVQTNAYPYFNVRRVYSLHIVCLYLILDGYSMACRPNSLWYWSKHIYWIEQQAIKSFTMYRYLSFIY